MAKNINDAEFDEATKLKLKIFGDCFEEWLPVFNYAPHINEIYIFDFFAGSGKDSANNPGSPLILLDKAKGKDRKYCSNALKEITFIFNEGIESKSIELNKNIEEYIERCREKNKCQYCNYRYYVENYDFRELFNKTSITNILNSQKIGKFILLDQYGFKEVNDDIFQQLVTYPKTDFIFFISSSNIKRFKEHENVKRYIKTSKIDFDESKPKECHRIIADYYRGLAGSDFFIHHFTIKKGTNYWGLIFGTAHSYGMEKFLKICWKEDDFSGEANINIDDNWGKDTLFYNPNSTVKKVTVKNEIKEKICNGEIYNNIAGLKYTMRRGCKPKLFTEVVQELEKNGVISRSGDVNNDSTKIHTVKEYQIIRLDDET